jgi:hypothetical protein
MFEEGRIHRELDMERLSEATIDLRVLMDVRAELDDPRKRWAWAVDFAQVPLAKLSPEKFYEVRVALTAFAGWAAGTVAERKQVLLFTDEEVRGTQRRFERIVKEYIEHQTADLGKFGHVRLRVITIDGRMTLITNVGAHDLLPVDRAVFALGLLLDGHTDCPKVCPAPRPWGDKGEQCNRWFVGRPDQLYCSPICRNRATTRASRQKKRVWEVSGPLS